MTLSFQQSNLALNLCETFINLHRPYYAKALYDDTHTTDTSIYAQSFYAVIERCAVSTRTFNLLFMSRLTAPDDPCHCV